MHIYTQVKKDKKCNSTLSSQNSSCIPANEVSRTESYIEARWMWLQRKAINNSTFRNESDIGKAVSDWTCNYNNSHDSLTRNSLHHEFMCLFT